MSILLVLFGVTFLLKKTEVIRPAIGLGLILTPIIYFYLILEAHTLNIPFTDDYNLLETIANFRKETDFVKSIEILFEQVNQHRFAFERIVMLIMVFITGTINIKLQIFLGNLFMLGILYLFFATFKKEQISWYYFIPVPYILFNLVYYENAFWGIAAIQNTPLIFFAFLSAYGLSRQDRKGWIIGLLAAITVTFVSGSGMLAWIIGVIILFLQKEYRLLFQWLAFAAGIIAFYFLFDYYFIPTNGEKPWKHPIFNTIYVLGFFGNGMYLDIPHPSATSFYKDMILCVLLGAMISVVFFVWFLRIIILPKLQWTYWYLLGAFMFVMGTGCMFVVSRPLSNYLMFGGSIFSRRYMIFGVVIIATMYVAMIILAKTFKTARISIAFIGMMFFLVMNGLSYFMSLPQMRKQYEELSLDGFYYKNFATFLTTGIHFGDIPFWNHPTRMKELVTLVEKNGLSNLYESDLFPPHQQVLKQTENRREKYKGKVDVQIEFRENEQVIPPKSIHFLAGEQNGVKPSYFVLVSEKYTLLLPALPKPNSFSAFVKTKNYYDRLYQYTLFRTKLPAGKYELWMMSEKGENSGQWESKFTGKKIFLY
ncbi:hypothetical protein E0F88_19990 [Dyadobacter psychrotolerans]|uniref:Glycosyltransferase RgtA/B/C/D-like domain-containing protein n=1 Tax=Dyadobacter psychrotolerans TaxID=2541721 RepID=A0A4R5DRJ2_9BACT|nr:hypothetical protein E0F88_19990 [Dyadobacter psychrotolerans]